jgi:hypothetical protein
MRTRRIIACVLAAVTVLVLLAGLIDPVEGGIALLVAAGLVLATWALSRLPIPRLEWMSWIAAVVVGAVAIGVGLLYPEDQRPGGEGLFALPGVLIVLVLVYEAAALSTIGGGVLHVVRLVQSLRGATGADGAST